MTPLRKRVAALESASAGGATVLVWEGQDEAAAIAARYPDGPPPGLVVYRLRWARTEEEARP